MLDFRRQFIPLCFLLTSALPASAQTPASNDIPATVQVNRGLEYARYGERVLKLDLYLPANAVAALPVIVVVAGGGYESVSSEETLVESVAMAKRGLAALAIEYRGPREMKFPATVQDVKAAVRWAKANAQRYGFDANAVGVMGGSFGGQLAA